MTDQRLAAWKTAGEWLCRIGQEEGDVGWRRVRSAFPDIGERRATWLSKMARANGYDWQTIDSLLESPQNGSRLEPVNGPEADEPIESLIDRRCNAFKRLDAAAQDEIEIRVKDDKPIGILLFSDPHVDDDGTDLPLIVEHRRLVIETEGLYGGCIGDVLNNWVGKLARLYGAQGTSEAEAWRLAEWYFSEVPWLFFVMGNHDRWGQGGNVLRHIAKGNVIAATHEQEIKLRLTNPTWGRDFRIWARHDFKGTSQYQSVQGMLRAAKMRQYQADLYVAGHTHDAGFYSEPREDGAYFTALRLGSYKVHDDYAAEKGFPKKKGGEAALVIIDKDRHLVTFDVEAGADYLSWLRQRR